jgi:hypothetical protein
MNLQMHTLEKRAFLSRGGSHMGSHQPGLGLRTHKTCLAEDVTGNTVSVGVKRSRFTGHLHFRPRMHEACKCILDGCLYPNLLFEQIVLASAPEQGPDHTFLWGSS